jgi:hypothetical protein
MRSCGDGVKTRLQQPRENVDVVAACRWACKADVKGDVPLTTRKKA